MRTRLLPLLLLLGPVAAQDEDLPPDEVADIVERYIERGVESLREGNYEEARLRFHKALRREPGCPAAHLGAAEAYRLVGAYEKAEGEIDALLEAHPADRGGLVAKARLVLLRGRLPEAKELAQQVIDKGSAEGPDLDGMRARLVVAESLARRGLRGEARTALDFFLDYHERRLDSYSDANFNRDILKHKPEIARPLSEELTVVAAALRMYVDLSPLDEDYIANANELLLLAQELDPENWEAWIERVRVTRAEREGALASARKARDLVTPKNPELADLWTEVAKSLLTGFDSGEARAMAEKAVKVNPKQTDARAVVARVALEDNEYPAASDHIDAGLAVDPYHRDLLALKATLELLLGNDDAFEEGMKRMLAVDPTYGEGFHLAGLVVAGRQRRYDRGAELVRRGLELDPANFQAHATLGIFLANLGRAAEAKEALDKSRELFPWSHPIRENFRVVLDYVLGTMTEAKTEHFVIRFDPGEYEVLSLFLPELLEDCWDDMVKRYGFTPRAPVLVEIFRKADDFSVRTLGLPGIPALGACFGGLVTLDSPQALEAGQFIWAAVARHEFAHVMSLQLSKGQVPRWFTEGLSVLEERPLDTGWGMEDPFEREVYDAYHTGTLPEVATFDAMFRTGRVAFAYYLGGLMLQFLEQRTGEKGIVEALRLYGEDRPMEEVFDRAFDLKLEEFDTRFREFLGARIKDRHRVPDYSAAYRQLREQALRAPDDGETLVKLAWAHFFREEYVDAGARFDQARGKYDAGYPLARLLEARLLLRAGKAEQAREILEAFFAAGGEDHDARMIQAAFLRREGKKEELVAALEKAKAAWPTAMAPYAELRRHYLSEGRTADALKVLEEQTRIASKSIPLRLELARAYGAEGRSADAIRALEEAVNVTPFVREVHEAVLPLYRESGATKKAVRAARCLVALRAENDSDEERADRWLTLAEVLLDDGQAKEAETAVAEAERLAAEERAERIAQVRKRLGQ